MVQARANSPQTMNSKPVAKSTSRTATRRNGKKNKGSHNSPVPPTIWSTAKPRESGLEVASKHEKQLTALLWMNKPLPSFLPSFPMTLTSSWITRQRVIVVVSYPNHHIDWFECRKIMLSAFLSVRFERFSFLRDGIPRHWKQAVRGCRGGRDSEVLPGHLRRSKL